MPAAKKKRPVKRQTKVPPMREVLARANYCGPLVNYATLFKYRTKKIANLTTGELVCRFAEDYLAVPEGSMVGLPLKFDPFQAAFIQAVFDNPHGTRKAILSVGRRAGKALPVDTPIPTPDGFKPMGELAVGDCVFDEQGKTCRVTDTTPVMINHDCYRLTFADLTSIVADRDHLWAVYDKTKVKPLKGINNVPLDIKTTGELLDDMDAPPGNYKNRYAIPYLTNPVDYPHRDLPIDPYLLGVWLGDGTRTTSGLTLGLRDADHIIARLQQTGEPLNILRRERGSCYCSVSNGKAGKRTDKFIHRLRTLGLAPKKHIPDQYLIASVAQRRALLQGLMDTDGYVCCRGQAEFTSKDRALCETAAELVRSLGMRCSLTSKPARCNGKDYGLSHIVRFYPTQQDNVVTVPFKRGRLSANRTKDTASPIVTIEPVPSVPVKCITVDSPNSLYLAGREYIVTHNTFVIAIILLACIVGPVARENSLVCSAALSRDQAALCFRLMLLMLQSSPELAGLWRAVPSGKKIFGLRKNVEYNALSADAKKGHGRLISVLLLDEAGQIAESENDYISMLRTSQGNYDDAMMFIVSTQAPSDHSFLSQEIDNATRKDAQKTVCHVYTTDPEADPMDEREWYFAQPSLGKYRSLIDIREQVKDALRLPAKLPGVLNLLFNQRVSLDTLAISPMVWKENAAQADPTVFQKASLVSLGLDLSTVNDLSAAVLTAKDDDDNLHVRVYAFSPQGGIAERSRRDKVPYDTWAAQEIIYAPPGDTLNYDLICQFLRETLAAEGIPVHQVHFDRYRIDVFKAAAQRQGFAQDAEFKDCGQGFVSMGPRIDALETALLERKVRHGMQPVLTLAAAHAVMEIDNVGNKRLTKKKSAQKIDALVALVMSAWPLVAPEEDQTIDIAALVG